MLADAQGHLVLGIELGVSCIPGLCLNSVLSLWFLLKYFIYSTVNLIPTQLEPTFVGFSVQYQQDTHCPQVHKTVAKTTLWPTKHTLPM